MKKRMGLFAIIIAVVALGVGYAAIADINLNVNNSTASIEVDDSNFTVAFKAVGTFTKTGDGDEARFTRTDDHNVSFTLTGFTKKGDEAIITIPFENTSETLKASLADAVITNSNSEYFAITATSLSGTVLAEAGESGSDANLVITVTAKKTPITDDVSTTITATVKATPQN